MSFPEIFASIPSTIYRYLVHLLLVKKFNCYGYVAPTCSEDPKTKPGDGKEKPNSDAAYKKKKKKRKQTMPTDIQGESGRRKDKAK